MIKIWIKMLLQLFISLFCFIGYAQITVGLEVGKRMVPIPSSLMDKIKHDTLVVVTPNYLGLETIDNITEEIWTIGPSKAIAYDSLTAEQLLNPDYLFLAIDPNLSSGPWSTGGIDLSFKGTSVGAGLKAVFSRIYLELFKIDPKKIAANNHSNTNEITSFEHIMEFKESKLSFARFFLHDYIGVVNDINGSVGGKERENLIEMGLMNTEDKKLEFYDITRLVYQKDYFHNLNEGFYQNIIQLIAAKLSANDVYSSNYLNKADAKRIISLRNHTLYVPSYLSLHTKGAFDKVVEDYEWLENKLEKYDFEYEIIDSSKLSEKILQKKEIYYLRYYSNESWQQIEVVEAMTGTVVWSNQEKRSPFSTEIKKSHFKALNKAVN